MKRIVSLIAVMAILVSCCALGVFADIVDSVERTDFSDFSCFQNLDYSFSLFEYGFSLVPYFYDYTFTEEQIDTALSILSGVTDTVPYPLAFTYNNQFYLSADVINFGFGILGIFDSLPEKDISSYTKIISVVKPGTEDDPEHCYYFRVSYIPEKNLSDYSLTELFAGTYPGSNTSPSVPVSGSLVDSVTPGMLDGVMNQVVSLIPLIIPVLVAYIGLRKGLDWVLSMLHNS